MMNKKDWTGNKTSVFSTLAASSHSKDDRANDDYYCTPPTKSKCPEGKMSCGKPPIMHHSEKE